MAKEIQLCEMSISSYKERFGKNGKVLKNAFSLGPSKAALSNGKIIEPQDAPQQAQNDEPTPAPAPAADQQQSDQSAPSEQTATNDSYIRVNTFSLLEAYSNMSLMFEAGKGKKRKKKKNKNRQTQQNSTEQTNVINDTIEAPRDIPPHGDYLVDAEQSEQPQQDETSQSNEEPRDQAENEEEPARQDSFTPGETYTFKLEMENEGFTEWTVLFDSRADVETAKNAIRAKKFKAAMQAASKDLESDGLVPIKARTCIYEIKDFRKMPAPNFIGHCRYAFDSGSDEDTSEDNLTICLAVAPINAATNKPDNKTVIQAIYNVTGDITGGKIGQLGAAISKKLRDHADGKRNYGGYDDDDKDSEKSLSEELSKYLHNAFRCVGDHTMYKNYLAIRKFLSKQIAAKNIEFLTYKIGDKNVNTLVKKFPLGQLVYF